MRFSIDEGSPEFGFVDRLAKENSWSSEYALRVVEEYKKFIFLAMAAEHPVSPSESIDHAWHLHLIYTRSYWERFCGRLLGKPIHHTPSMGGEADKRKFEGWYAKTCDSYEQMLGASPPADIWPRPGVMHRATTLASQTRRLQHWLVPHHKMTLSRLLGWSALGLLITEAGCSTLLQEAKETPLQPDTIAVVVLVIVMVVGLFCMGGGSGCGYGWSSSKCGGGDCGGGCGGD